MKALPGKPAAKAGRSPVAGLPPVSPDRRAEPRSARTAPRQDAAGTASLSADLDRSRRLSRSDPQGRYGNAEVARVAMQQNPAPIGARKMAARGLPEAGAVAAKPKEGGHGKPSAHPGAARAAVEAKHIGDKEKQDTERDKKTPAPKDKTTGAAGKGTGADEADEARGARDEKKGAKKDDGDGARDGGDEAAVGGGAGGGGMAASEPPPARPRLEGTAAVILSMPKLADQQRDRIRAQTGFSISEHYARVQVHLDRLSARATSEQLAIVLHIELIESEVRRDLDNAATRIAPAVSAGIDTVRGACASARAAIKAAHKDALATIEGTATAADKTVDSAALSTKAAVEKAVAASSPQVRALYDETMKPLRDLLKTTGEAFAQKGKDQGVAMVKKGASIEEALTKLGGNAIDLAINEKRGEAAVAQAAKAQQDLVNAGLRGQQDILAQEAALGLSFLMLVNPVAVKMEKVVAADAKDAGEKGEEIRLRLRTDYERATALADDSAERALKALDALEKSAVKHLQQMGRSLEEMAAARRDQICNAILAGRQPAADAWAQQMTAVNDLVPPEQIVDWRPLDPRFVDALASMNVLSTRQRLDFDAQARSGFDDARAGMDGDRDGLDQSVESFVDSARATRRQAVGLNNAAQTIAKGFLGAAHHATKADEDFRTTTEEKLGLSVGNARKQMAKLLADSRVKFAAAVTTFDTRLAERVTLLPNTLEPTFAVVAVDVPLNLSDRAGRAFRAMDKVGTDETGLFEALYGMTPRYGAALEAYWNQSNHVHNLWWWLDDELSGDEYETAKYYLLGDPAKAVRYQIQASFHWYGNDVKQMESGLRALTPKQMEDLNKDPAFAEVKAKLQQELKGTNLLVTEALFAGRVARADALRLKEQIDAARAAGDDDKLHDLLSAIDKNQLPNVRTEFVDILSGHAMTATAPVAPADKKALEAENETFTTYITKPVEVYEPGHGEYDSGRMVTKTLTEPSKELAKALATTGEGSVESRAARLAYETTRGGKPRPERLARALDDPELVAAKNDPILKQKDADPKERQAAEEHLARLEARRGEMMTKFATLRGADEKTRKDPARAQAYTEKAVGDLFGDDALGRELGTSMVKDGRANPAVAIKFAVRGWGTNEELIRKTLRGMSAEEIKALREDYAKRFGDNGKNKNALFDDLGVFQNKQTAAAAGVPHATGGGFFTELSGDERHEVEELLLGTPKNDRDRMRMARLKYTHQKGEGTTWVGTALLAAEEEPLTPGLSKLPGMASGSAVGQSLDMNKSRMEEMVVAAGGEEAAFDKDGNFKGVPGRFSPTDFRVHTAATSEMAENYKHHIDSLVDMITGAIAIIGAIVGTIVVTVLTLGTATPLVIGLWAAGIALATGAAVMATKYALKGSRYGWEEAAVDAAVTLVDAATAGVTAGAGARGARALTQLKAVQAAARTPAQEALAGNLLKQQVRKETARGFVRAAAGAGTSGTARTAMTDGVWDDGVMTGLGRTVSGGAHAAIIGTATHGASHAFSKSGLGEKLGQSTSFLKRGFGSGVGGALGGMAGRSTELSLDALGGHAQEPWYDALGSIALAGGRGFAENFGQGMAEVPKARRDAAQDALDASRKKSDVDRVSRYGTGLADEAGDLRFRRMAVAAALENDPKTNPRQFLADLDAAVATDRFVAETHRQTVRAFRREALAAIPPARRGEFADVAIHVLPDAEFEKFTGSLSGRAVTIIVDGEPQIVVRRSATPESLREEGIHVLQSREPRWREGVARLDERTMQRWDELDLETQLSLYRNKVEIELDAQQRLRQNLVDEAERTPDTARRAALRVRVDEAEHTFKALRARRDEVDLIGPERLAAIRRGDERRPQYLREPARLFAKRRPVEIATEEPTTAPPAKKPEPAAPPPEPHAEPAAAPRRPLEELRAEASRLRQIDPAQRTPTDVQQLAAIDAEIKGHYTLAAGESHAALESRVLGRQEGETDAAYRKRLISLKDEVVQGAAQLADPELRDRYDRLVLALKRPLAAVRDDLDALRSIPRAERTKKDNRKLFRIIEELEAHYLTRPGHGIAEVEARLLARIVGESDAEYRQRLLSLRDEVDEHAAIAGVPEMVARLDRLTQQLRRPMADVRTEINDLVSSGRDLTSPERLRLRALEDELASHYLERPGETNRQLEERLFAQGQKESIDDYLVRLRRIENEVAAGVETTGSERVLDHYLQLVTDVEADIGKRPALEAQIRQARAEAEFARRCWDLHRRAWQTGRERPNLPTFSTMKVEELEFKAQSLEAELKALETRSSARSARYTFADLGSVDPCFLPGTPVVTPSGVRPIDTLVEGDEVLARMPGELPVAARVAKVHRSATRTVVTLGVRGETIRTTAGHPFWSDGDRAWQPAKALVPGDILLTLAGPQRLDTVTIDDDDLQPTLNLEVEGLHTFLVGTAGALVHNGTRRPGFDDPVKRPTRIYRVVLVGDDGSVSVIYIGKTYQGGRGNAYIRFEQHLATKAEWAKWRAQTAKDGGLRLRIQIEAEGDWTVFETAVWEEHAIRKYRLNRSELEKHATDPVDLQNKGVPVTKESFNRYRSRFRGC